MNTKFQLELADHLAVMKACADFEALAESTASLLSRTFFEGGKLLLCGNGGSAADAQHLAAEFVVRFRRHRRGLPAISLTTDASALTAIGNDYDFSQVFSRQVEALGRPGDILIAISTSGNSANVIEAVKSAKENGLTVIVFTGSNDSELSAAADILFAIPSTNTARIQEAYLFLGHMLCEWIECNLIDQP